ncbi:histidine kinase [Fragilaria crotonensis]|nr:histidine kinase [Fragilaria crotonensis]
MPLGRGIIEVPHDGWTAASVDFSSVTDSFYPRSEDGDDALEFSTVADEVVLYGRTRETNLLLGAYSELSSNNQPQKVTKVIVHGDAGSGKTSLVDLLRKPVFDTNGFFVSGKYSQNSSVQEPNSAIMAALSDLCDLLIQSPDFTEERRTQFQLELGVENGRILEKCITNLSPLLGKPRGDEGGSADMSVRNVAAYTRFKVAFKTFLQAVSCDKHPIVLFIDDIQWMDESSRKLIEVLLHDQELSSIMVILAYRDEESASVADILDEMKNNEDTLDLALDNLDTDAVLEIVSSVTGSSTSSTKELSSVIAKKTMGNPYHVMKLLEFLQWEGLLVQNTNAGTWGFDVDRIQYEVTISVTLAEILALKVHSLPNRVQESLKIASLLGYRFTGDLVVRVRSYLLDKLEDESDDRLYSIETCSVSSVSTAIGDAVRGGFVEKIKVGYQFSHDTIQTAFQSLIDDEEKGRMHDAIGNVLLAIGDAESRYRASVHLFNSPRFVRDDANRIELARLHLEAAGYCEERSAFIDAAAALHRGLALLDDARKWTDFYDLAFEMTETLARKELIIGNYDSCTEMTNEVLHHAKTMSMRINALLIGVECVMARNDMEGSIASANRALSSLGLKMPRKVSFGLLASNVLKIKMKIGRKSDEDILSLPLMRDEAATATSRILVNLCMYCFLKDEDNLGIYAALLALQLTLKFGLNAYSACALANYGVAELFNGNYRGAYRFGKLALTLLEKMPVRDAECATTAVSLALLAHWYEPVRGATKPLRRAASIGFEVGDVIYGTYCLAMMYGTETVVGTNLEKLEASMRADARTVADYSQEAMDMWTQPIIQYVLNLRNDGTLSWLELTTLTGEFMDEATYIRRALASNHRLLAMMTLNFKATLACSFGFWSMAESLFAEVMSMGKTFFFCNVAMTNSLFSGIASYSCYQQNGKRKHLLLARKNRTRLATAVSRGCANAHLYPSFLDAEDLAIRKSSSSRSVSAAYNTAIEKFVTVGFPHMEAYACERAGFFQAKLGNRDDATYYFQKALDLYYNAWGSIARHDWLVEHSERALARIELVPNSGPPIHSIFDTFKQDITF